MTIEVHTPAQMAALIDHAVLKPNATSADLARTCALCDRLNLFSLCVRPGDVADAARLLAEAVTEVGTVVGFPHGANAPTTKAAEATRAVADGAAELDMVLNIGRVLDGRMDYVRDDIAAVVDAAQGRCVKVILECCYLSDAQIDAACAACVEAGANFVKTSTGFGTHGAKVEHVARMRAAVGDALGVKAAGGIATLADARAMLAAGANRLGTSKSESILQEMSP